MWASDEAAVESRKAVLNVAIEALEKESPTIEIAGNIADTLIDWGKSFKKMSRTSDFVQLEVAERIMVTAGILVRQSTEYGDEGCPLFTSLALDMLRGARSLLVDLT